MKFYEQIESGIEGQDTIIDASAVSNLPEQVQANWDETDVNSKSYIQNKPSIPKEFTQQQVDWNSTSGVTSILNKPTFAPVATSGNYNDLSNTPTIPAAQVQANWNETNESSKAFILNKPNLAAVATSGNYNDLKNLPAKGVQTVNGVSPDVNGNVNTPDTTYTPGAGINISGTEISNSGVRSISQNGSVITVNTGGSTSTITIPESGKIDNISFNGSNLTISNKTVTLPAITLEAWDTASDNKTTFTIVGQKNN